VAGFAISRATADVARRYGAQDVVYLPTGVDHDTFRVCKPIQDRDTRIAMAYVPRAIKDPETALAALHLVREQLPAVEVRAFGAVRRPTTWPPWINYRRHLSDIALARDVYNESAIFVSSSILEGFGLPMAEGMACGCAIACTDSGGVRDFAEHHATALLSARDVGAPAHPATCGGPRASDRLARSGQARIAEFTWGAAATSSRPTSGLVQAGGSMTPGWLLRDAGEIAPAAIRRSRRDCVVLGVSAGDEPADPAVSPLLADRPVPGVPGRYDITVESGGVPTGVVLGGQPYLFGADFPTFVVLDGAGHQSKLTGADPRVWHSARRDGQRVVVTYAFNGLEVDLRFFAAPPRVTMIADVRREGAARIVSMGGIVLNGSLGKGDSGEKLVDGSGWLVSGALRELPPSAGMVTPTT
jgi:hypothetical protein